MYTYLANCLKHFPGLIYVNKTPDNVNEVVFCMINEKGRRTDVKCKPEDIVLIGFKNKLTQFFNVVHFKIKDDVNSYKLFYSNCKIHDEKSFESIFGGYEVK